MPRTCHYCGRRAPMCPLTRPECLGLLLSPSGMWTQSAKSRLRGYTCWRMRTMPSGPVRRGQLISPFGPGAMMVLPNGVSVICGGLDHWFRNESGDAENIDLREYEVDEWRLAARLGVQQ